MTKTEERVLILAPSAQEATAIASLLNSKGTATQIASDPAACLQEMSGGAAVLMLAEEALELPNALDLLKSLSTQPLWSELPVILLTSAGAPHTAKRADLPTSAAGRVTLLERPVRPATLWQSVEVALLARRRQYQVRNLLDEQHRNRNERDEEARGHLAAIVEYSDDAIVSKNLNGVITSWNRGAERLFGYTAHEAIGQPVTLLIPPDRLDEEPGILQRIVRGELVEHYHTVRRRKDGTLLDISLTVSPVRNDRGHIVGASKIARDITERRRAERALLESEERYRTLVSHVHDYAIFRTDPAGLPTSWNQGVRAVLGFDREEFVGHSVVNTIFTPDDLSAGVPQRELQIAAAEGSTSDDRWMRRKDGSLFFASGTTTVLKDDSGTVSGFTKVLRDVTEKKLAQQRLEQIVAERTADLRSSNEQLETFVYSIAHDLRAPLRAITGYSQLLVEDNKSVLDQMTVQMLQRIQASSEFMDKLLIDLLAYTRTARSELELSRAEVLKAWEMALFQCSSDIARTRAQIETLGPLPSVRAHEATFGQVLANLLDNSIKFVAEGVQPSVRFRAEDRGQCVRLWVEDNGIGIPTEHHERVFRIFERLHGETYPGTGIGLSIVRKGVERMGGKVGLESDPGKGTRFWIELAKAN